MTMSKDELASLLKQQEELSRKIQEARIKGRDDGVAEIKRIMSELGITAEMLGFYAVSHVPASKKTHAPTFKQKRVFGPVEPKYRDPATGQTWSGRGREPRWMVEGRDAYLINPEKAD
jgi:DNA-binding protein H-NS